MDHHARLALPVLMQANNGRSEPVLVVQMEPAQLAQHVLQLQVNKNPEVALDLQTRFAQLVHQENK